MLELRLKRSDPEPGRQSVPEIPLDAQVWRDRQGVHRMAGFTTEGEHWLHMAEIPASFRFNGTDDWIEAFAAENTDAATVEDAYRRCALPFALQAQGHELLHASAVEMNRGAFAFCGGSRVGKSTTAATLAKRGHRPLADDALLWESVDGGIEVRPLPFALWLIQGRENGDRAKQPEDVQGDLGGPVPLAAVFVLEPDVDVKGDPVMVPLPGQEAFSMLLYHAHCFSFQDDQRRRRMLERYLELSAAVPTFRVRYRPEWDAQPGLLEAIQRIDQ